jgi:hypothetical protein
VSVGGELLSQPFHFEEYALTLTTISGLPAHVLLVHALVVLAPLTALLEILCALWPAARRSWSGWCLPSPL